MISLFDLLKIGIGPSSSHTVGPMLATGLFANELESRFRPEDIRRIRVELFGSLALTGEGHRTDRAVIAGLLGEHPRTVAPESLDVFFDALTTTSQIAWLGKYPIPFDLKTDLLLHKTESLPQHPNGIRCTAFGDASQAILEREYFSVGGGFVVDSEQITRDRGALDGEAQVEFPFHSGDELLQLCAVQGLSFAEIVHRNELYFHSADEISRQLGEIWEVMSACIHTGCITEGILPGGLGIRRRAPEIYRKLKECVPNAIGGLHSKEHHLETMDWVTMFALAVNEQNAAGGRVVTAPTNGAAGVIPAVLAYYERFSGDASVAGIHTFLKTAAAVGMLYKRNASLSAAEMGCQGEVGVACSMAAAGLAAVMGGTPAQVENAAEIGMEHNLGLTCDPIAGLVQVPCIERNTMGAVKAINAARLAVLYGDGQHRVSLDRVIETMRQTGLDMQSKYKETSLGGLAVNVINC